MPTASSRARVDESTSAAIDAMNDLRRIVVALRLADRESHAELGVSAAQLFVLREIAKAGVLTIGALARCTATAQSSVSEVVSRLVTRGLVERRRSEEDHRRAEISLSPTGRRLLRSARETVQERLLAAFGRLSPEQQREAAETLGAWSREAGLSEQSAPMFFEP